MENFLMIVAWVFGALTLILHIIAAMCEYDENGRFDANLVALRDGVRGYSRNYPIFKPGRTYSLLLCICYLVWFYFFN